MKEIIFGEQRQYKTIGFVKNLKKKENFSYFQLKTLNNGYIDCLIENTEIDSMIENEMKIELISYYPKQLKVTMFGSTKNASSINSYCNKNIRWIN